jgi:hypothetical protein
VVPFNPPIKEVDIKTLQISLSFAALFALAVTAAPEAHAQTTTPELATDSVSGTLVERLPEGFVLLTDDGDRMVLEIVGDTVQQIEDLSRDSVPDPVPHGSVMDRRNVEFVLRQLEESDERTRMHVHYVTPTPASGRHLLVWISIAEDRVPGA